MKSARLNGLLTGVQNYLRRHWRAAFQLRERLILSEEALHLVLAGVVGIVGGLVNLVFFYGIEHVKLFFLRSPGDPVEVAEMMAG